MIHEYVALQDTLHGIRKNDIIEFDDVEKKSVLRRNKKVLPLDVTKEISFFQFVPPTPLSVHSKGDKVHSRVKQKLKIVKAPKHTQVGKFFDIHPFAVLEIVDVKFNTPVSPSALRRKTKKRNYFYVVSLGKYEYQLDCDESLIEKTQYYWFVSSRGTVGQDIVGRDAAADAFRKKNKNFFTTSKEASDKLKTLK